jgi:hypothetical protein
MRSPSSGRPEAGPVGIALERRLRLAITAERKEKGAHLRAFQDDVSIETA